ncbi:MAG: prepilin peptidase [Candidatus Dependentiae bacterium]|jgi:leader peptidase (prepilin peptidase)/N-methyltransferase
MSIVLVYVVFIGICWGSLLNMVAHRLLYGDFNRMRSFCPNCKKDLAWYDLVPLLSFVVLSGRCRYCRTTISYLYPALEVLSGLLALLIWLHSGEMLYPTLYHRIAHLFCYGMFASGLLVALRTDLEAMVTPRMVPIVLLPLGILNAMLGILPISVIASLSGCLFGYGFLWALNKVYIYLRGVQGIGEGDMDILSVIGAFMGPIGLLEALTFASLSGIVVGLLYLVLTKQGRQTRIPFAPFLALGAFVALYSELVVGALL